MENTFINGLGKLNIIKRKNLRNPEVYFFNMSQKYVSK